MIPPPDGTTAEKELWVEVTIQKTLTSGEIYTQRRRFITELGSCEDSASGAGEAAEWLRNAKKFVRDHEDQCTPDEFRIPSVSEEATAYFQETQEKLLRRSSDGVSEE